MSAVAITLIAPLLVLPPQDDASAETSSPKAAEYRLVYKFNKGDVIHYEVGQVTSRNSRRESAVQSIKDTIREFKHMEVVNVEDDGSFILQTVFDRVVMGVDFGSKKVDFDSSKPKNEDPAGFGHVRKLIARPQFQIHVKPTGELIGIRRLAAGRSANAKDAGKSKDGSSTLVVFPDKPIRIGDTWKEDYTVKLKVSKDIERDILIFRTYRLNSVKDGVAKLSFATSLKSPVRSPSLRARLIQATPSGTVEFDIEAGQLLRRTIELDEIVMNPDGPRSMLKTASRRVEKRVQPTAAKEPAESAE